MARQVTYTVYNYDELTDQAKAKARDWYREQSAQWWDASAVIENAVYEAADILGIEFTTRLVQLVNGATRYKPAIYYSVAYCQGDGASFEGRYSYKKGAQKALQNEFPQDQTLQDIAKNLQDIQRKHFYGLSASVSTSGGYSREDSMSCSVESDRTPYADLSEAESDILEAMRDFARWIYKQLREDIEGENEDEAVEESIRANEYEFTEHGFKV